MVLDVAALKTFNLLLFQDFVWKISYFSFFENKFIRFIYYSGWESVTKCHIGKGIEISQKEAT
jgi:hypothetical protein